MQETQKVVPLFYLIEAHVTSAVTAASHETNTGTTGAAPRAKGKKHPPKDEDEGVRAKKKSKFKSIEFVDSEAEVDTQAGPFKDKGKRKAGTPAKLEGSEKGESSASRVSELEPGFAL